jgi:APA family basic amino acid/polyamine antiporter
VTQQDTATASAPVNYVRRLGVWSSSMVVVGGVIGAGIFRNPGSVAARTNSAEATLAAWAIGGALALIGAFCYAELGTRRPQAGGAYVYLREAWGPMIAFLYGWIMLLVNYSGSLAAVAMIFATYLCAAFDWPGNAITPLSIGAIALLTGINYFGIRAGAVVQNVLTLLKLFAIVALVVTGLFIAAPAAPNTMPPLPAVSAWNFGAILMPVMFSYGGWAYINNIAGEIREPQRNLPRALILGMALVAACYLLANLAYLHVLGHDGLAASAAPAATVIESAFGDGGRRAISLGIAISSFGFCNISIIGAARVFQVMAADGVFFRSVAHMHPRYHSPDVAIIAVSGWALVLSFLTNFDHLLGLHLSSAFDQLLNYSTLGDWIGYAGAVATLFYYRRARASEAATFRTPGYPLLPIVFIAGVLVVVASNVVANPSDAGVGLLMTLAGIPAYWAWTRRNRPAAI